MYNQNSGYGQALLNMVANAVPTFGKVFVVMNAANTDEENYQRMSECFPNDPNGDIRFFTSLASAYAACESNNNDVILLDANSSHSHLGELAVSNSRTHFIGMDGGGRLHGQGAKVQSTAGTAAVSVLHVSGTRNTFKNIKFIQADDEATSQNVLKESGESSLYRNCSFIFGDVDELDQTDTYEILMSGDSTELHSCTIGADTLLTSAARAGVAFDVITQAAKSTVWKDCIFNVATSSADYNFIRVVATSDLHFGHLFINPIFLATISDSMGAITVTDALDSVSGLNAGNILMINPATNGTSLSGTASDNLKVVGMDMNGGAGTATVGVGITPN